ncbi:hypothetical protein HYC85_011672 [Camellia sinensis]|uniref:Uncharacterized protein n=1 Tax=Camellia sinensis TaxID=4442 RepID=A0A7J7HA11_CAMSI|nr:hypothetical protein HYC85_011672 [Camellia sinensis]
MVVMEHGSIAEKEVKNNHGCCKGGPWYSSPLAAMSGPRESLIYVTCVYTSNNLPFPSLSLHFSQISLDSEFTFLILIMGFFFLVYRICFVS